jgi:ankyrin repeat protein
VYEHHVDAAGGEVKRDCDAFVKIPPQDCSETLSHIVAERGDSELLEWLDTHGRYCFGFCKITFINMRREGADMEERNMAGFTTFHIALRKGHIPIVKYFFEAHSPEDSDAVYHTPEGTSLLALALESCKPELVWMILDKKLASDEEVVDAWKYITHEDRHSLLRKPGITKPDAKVEEITSLLRSFGGFTQVPKPEPSAQIPTDASSFTSSSSPTPLPGGPKTADPPHRNGGYHHHKAGRRFSNISGAGIPIFSTSTDRRRVLDPSQESSVYGNSTSGQSQIPDGRGRGRGRSRGRARGRGRGFRGRGRGGPPSPPA